MPPALDGTSALPHLGVIRAQGDEARKFLQGQLTNDFGLLGPSDARLAAFCSAKGRMLATFVGFEREPGDVLLVTPRDTLAATLKRLSMFVLRAKVKLTDASDQFALHGLAGSAADAATSGLQPWGKRREGDADLVRLYPADGQARALRVAPVGDAVTETLALSTWLWGEVRSGIAQVTTPIVDAFVPQMLNYESVGGVNFKKGCYPGQEVVARSQFRGTLKRRAFIVHADAQLQAGQEVFDAADASQPCGLVAEAAAAPGGGFDAIVSLQLAAADHGTLRAGAGDGAPLQVLPLPYPLLADV
jgi:tRNA-modifying protein YgfZ